MVADQGVPDTGDDLDSDTTSNSGQPDMDVESDASSGPDEGTPDMSPDQNGDMTTDYGRTLSDYRRCMSDADCPVGLGTCVTEVALNRADELGRQRVDLSEVFTDLAGGEGVCSAVCTTNETTCSTLSANGNTADAEPWICQLVVESDSPYPDPQTVFPFDGSLDSSAMASGIAFGALCRPPFQLDEDIDRGFCAPCTGESGCEGTSICWDWDMGAEATGTDAGECVSSCDAQGECPLGFTCEMTGGQDRCLPTQGTCTACRDHDEDGRGTGRCGTPEEPVTPVDCDDFDARAFFDPNDPTHPFPQYCDPANDLNCNGLSDEFEQVGTPKFGDFHCQSCGDTCSTGVTNGVLSCSTGSCVAECDTGFATCDGDEANGCEREVTDTTLQFYLDADKDGFGDLAVKAFACDATSAPENYVRDATGLRRHQQYSLPQRSRDL